MENILLCENKYFGFQFIKHVKSDDSDTFSLIGENTPSVSQWRDRNVDDILKLLTEHLAEVEENVRQTKQLINDIKTVIE